MLTCPTCQAPVTAGAEFCPSCLNDLKSGPATGAAAQVRTGDRPEEPERADPVEEALQFYVQPAAQALSGDLDNYLMLALIFVWGGLGIAAGVPLFHESIRWEYWWLPPLSAALAAGIAWAVVRIRSEVDEEAEARERKRAAAPLGAGVSGGVAQRGHALPNRHFVIAAVLLFAIGLGVGAFVHVNP